MGELVGCIEGIGEAARALDFPVVSAMCRSTTRRWAQAFPRPPRSAASASSTTSRKQRASLSRRRARTFGSSAARRTGSAAPLGSRRSQAARRVRRRPRSRRRTTQRRIRRLADPKRHGQRSPRPVGRRPRRGAGRDGDGGGKLRNVEAQGLSHAFFFGEDQGRYVLTAPRAESGGIAEEAKRLDVPLSRIGVTGGDALRLGKATPVALAGLAKPMKTGCRPL